MEEACDEKVVLSGCSGEDYAEMLFRQAKSQSGAALSLSTLGVARPSHLEQRIRRLLLTPRRSAVSKTDLMKNHTVTVGITCVLGMMCVSGYQLAQAEKDLNSPTIIPSGEKTVLSSKLNEIIISRLSVESAELEAVVDLLRRLSVENDPSAEGVNFILKGDVDTPLLSLDLSDVPLGEALSYVVELSNLEYVEEPHAVVIKKKEELAMTKKESTLEDLNRLVVDLRVEDASLRDTLQQLANLVKQGLGEEGKNRPAPKFLLVEGDEKAPRVNMDLENIPVTEALRYLAILSGSRYRIESEMVVFMDQQAVVKQPDGFNRNFTAEGARVSLISAE